MPQQLKRRPGRRRSSLFARGEPLVWLTGGSLVLCVVMIVGLLGYVLVMGTGTFWPADVTMVVTTSGKKTMGEVAKDETFRPGPELMREISPEARAAVDAEDGQARRRMFRTGNFDLTGSHYTWTSSFEVAEESRPEWALVVERLAWGRFYGFPREFLIDGEVVASEPAAVWDFFTKHHGEAEARRARLKDLETHDVGRANARMTDARLERLEAELDHGKDSPEWREADEVYQRVEKEARAELARINEEISELRELNARYVLRLETADGTAKDLALADIVRAYPANQLSFFDSVGLYLSRWWEFLSEDPRAANSEGGVFPAIFGTVIMTLIMSILVVPFGVLAALYLREYARQGTIVSIVRIAVNNLAGVPSIVFGVFGLGFFCYIVGGGIDQLFFPAQVAENRPVYGTGGVLWASLTLALLTLPVVIVATEEALSAVPNSMREGSYACGASKWQTIRRIVLPRAMPGVMTGMILAIARGAGEVAPLMLVGAVKLAPDLVLDGTFPYLHPERSFMHLGFHVYDLGFQSQNSEAAKPLVFTTTLLLIGIVVVLNVIAITVRSRLRRAQEGR